MIWLEVGESWCLLMLALMILSMCCMAQSRESKYAF